MQFISTRGEEKVTGAQAIVEGIARDGGLFVPSVFPAVPREELEAMLGMDYPERAAFILHKYLDEYDEEELLGALKKAYAQFEGGDAAPLVRVENGMYMLELFHGPTCAFKDMALTVLPYLLRKGCDLCGIKEKILILVATSGDTKGSGTQRASRSWCSIPTTACPKCRNCRCARRRGTTSTWSPSREISTTARRA